MKTLHTQYRLKSHPIMSQIRPFKLRPSSRIAFLFFSRATSLTICLSSASRAPTSTSRLFRCVAAGVEEVRRERRDCPADDSASRAAEP